MRLCTAYLLIPVLFFIGLACETAPPPDDAPEPGADAITPEPIPPGFDFPADRAALQALVDANDVVAMRTHAWNVWAGMTTASQSTFQGQTLPVWETWLATAQAFADPSVPLTTPPRQFVAPSQSAHLGLPVPDEEDLVVGFNKYDPEMVGYLMAAHPGPGGPSYRYTRKSSLDSLNNAWPDTTAIINRKVVDAPNRAMETKPVLLFVKQDSLTALPFWQGPSASTDPHCAGVTVADALNTADTTGVAQCHPAPNTWTHCVLIDPAATTTSLTAATQAQFDAAFKLQAPGCTDVANAHYGGLNMLYHFALNAAEAADFNNVQNPDVHAEAGDFAVLMAMHVNTKELVDWTWQTFWWQGGENPPENYPGSRDDMTANVAAPWSYYAMCAAYSQTTGPNNQGAMRVCFNPYLETSSGIPDGIQSNCVTCHGTARFPGTNQPGYPPDYSRPVDFGSPVYFRAQTRTDFSWAIPGNAN